MVVIFSLMQLSPHKKVTCSYKRMAAVQLFTIVKMIVTVKNKMVKQQSMRIKKRLKVFMRYKAISGSKSTSLKSLKKKLSLHTPDGLTVEKATDTVVLEGQLKGLRLLDLRNVSAAIANNLLCNVCKMQTLTSHKNSLM